MALGVKNNGIFKNASMLYLLTASNYVFGFITVPYLTRTLGVEVYGVVGFAQAIAVYMQLVLDFGFTLSATAEVAACERDKEKISAVASGVCASKCIIALFAGLLLTIACLVVPQLNDEWPLFVLFYANAVASSLLPDFVYRGIEKMEAITYRTVAVKLLFVLGVFLFVKKPEDYLLVPVLYLIGSLLAVVVAYGHLGRSIGIRLAKATFSDAMKSIRSAAPFFVSRIASTVYGALNTVVIGSFYPASVALGCFSAADKVIAAGKSACSPLADSMYPYMIRTNDYRRLIRYSLLGFLCLSLFAALFAVFAEPLCAVLFGAGYEDAVPMLRAMLPLIPISFLSYMFGFPALTPLGKKGFANASVTLGALTQIVLLVLLYVVGAMSVLNICFAAVATETIVAVSRMAVFCVALHGMGRTDRAELEPKVSGDCDKR